MKVSIIIPVYNVARYIEATLQSILQQTVQDFEVLLVDDHGKDDSVVVARRMVGEDQRFRFLETPVNSGPGIARNIGIQEAKGEYVVFLDGDDLWEPDFLESMLEASRKSGIQEQGNSGTLDLVYCQLKYQGGPRDGQVHCNPVVKNGVFSPSSKRHFLSHFVTFSVCFLFRRQFLLDNHLLFPALRNSEDTNFLTRCLLLAQTIACVPKPLYTYVIHEESLTTGRNPRRYKERLNALNALMSDFNALKRNPEYAALNLGQYNLAMWLIWLKKGLAQAVKEWLPF